MRDGRSDHDDAHCSRDGNRALRDIAEYLEIECDDDPEPDGAISVRREKLDGVYDQLAAEGVPVRDRETSWVAWAGWRVNYDEPLVGLARLTATPTMKLHGADVAG